MLDLLKIQTRLVKIFLDDTIAGKYGTTTLVALLIAAVNNVFLTDVVHHTGFFAGALIAIVITLTQAAAVIDTIGVLGTHGVIGEEAVRMNLKFIYLQSVIGSLMLNLLPSAAILIIVGLFAHSSAGAIAATVGLHAIASLCVNIVMVKATLRHGFFPGRS